MSGWDKLPMATSSGQLLALRSPQERAVMAETVWNESGGYERLVAELADPEFFREWSKELILKRLPKPVAQIEHGVSENVEALWDRLDRLDKATVIDAESQVLESDDT